MVCVACGALGRSPCPACERALVCSPDTVIGGLLVRAAFVHEGAARALVRRLKYDGIMAASSVLADAMAPLVPGAARVLVPVPRSLVRRARYGIDQSVVLAEELSRRTGLPVVRALGVSPLHLPNAGRRRAGRRPPRFHPRSKARGVVLVDDVLTTGTTLRAAADALDRGPLGAVTATRALSTTHAERLPQHR